MINKDKSPIKIFGFYFIFWEWVNAPPTLPHSKGPKTNDYI